MNDLKELSRISILSFLITIMAVAISTFSLPSILQIEDKDSDKTKTFLLVERESVNCNYKDNFLNCILLLKSTKDTIAILDIKDSRIIDNNGNLYQATFAQIGNNEKKSFFKISFVEDIPVRISISFDNLEELASEIALLEISIDTYGNNLPISENIRILDILISR